MEQMHVKDQISFTGLLENIPDGFEVYLSNDIYQFDTLILDTSDDLVIKAFSVRCLST